MSLKVRRFSSPGRAIRTADGEEFGVRAEYIRCAIYGLLGAVAVALVLKRVARSDNQAFVSALSLCGILSGLLIFLLHWRLRIDVRGVWRRRFITWQLWPWKAFASGQIGKPLGMIGYRWPKLPIGSRTLGFELLREADALRVRNAIQQRWMAPLLAPIPSKLDFKATAFTRMVADRSGLSLGRSGSSKVPWSQVRSVKIVRLEPDRADFHSLELKLPSRTLLFRVVMQHGLATTSWSGVKAEVLAAFLLTHIPADRVTCAVREFEGQQIQPEQVRASLAAAERYIREFNTLNHVMLVLAPAYVGLIGWVLIDGRSRLAVVVTAVAFALQTVVIGILWWSIRRLAVQRRNRLRAMLTGSA